MLSQVGRGTAALREDPRHRHHSCEEAQLCGHVPAGWRVGTFIVADSSKAGSTSIYRWNSNGFYSHQSLHPWHRDTHVEFLDVAGKPHLILSQRLSTTGGLPVEPKPEAVCLPLPHHRSWPTCRWSNTSGWGKFSTFASHASSVTPRSLRWEGQRFTEIQTLPSRGSMSVYPFTVGLRQYLILGSDFSFSRVYLWDDLTQRFQPFQELNMRAPRAFSLVTVDNKDILLTASFKGSTLAYQHLLVDLSAK